MGLCILLLGGGAPGYGRFNTGTPRIEVRGEGVVLTDTVVQHKQ
jgi:hypothetical protein